MYFLPKGGRVYKNPLIEAVRLSCIYDGVPITCMEWPLPEYWPIIPALDLWRCSTATMST